MLCEETIKRDLKVERHLMLVGIKRFIASLIFGLLWVAGGVFGIFTVSNDLAHYEALEKTGHRIAGKITDTSYETKRYGSKNDTIYMYETLRISYEVEGKTYTIATKDKLRIYGKTTNSIGDEVNLLADRENPADARVEKDNSAQRNLKYFSIAVLSIGLLILIKCGIAIRRGEAFI
jgi:hypothetical protein